MRVMAADPVSRMLVACAEPLANAQVRSGCREHDPRWTQVDGRQRGQVAGLEQQWTGNGGTALIEQVSRLDTERVASLGVASEA